MRLGVWEESFRQSTKESVRMGIEEERNTINFGSISDVCIRERSRESEWIQRSLWLKWGCTKDLCCHLSLPRLQSWFT